MCIRDRLKALAGELEARASRVVLAGDDAFVLSHDGLVRWIGEPVARLAAGEKVLEPRLRLMIDDHLPAQAREQIETRLAAWLKHHVTKLLGPLQILENAEKVSGIARGIASTVQTQKLGRSGLIFSSPVTSATASAPTLSTTRW